MSMNRVARWLFLAPLLLAGAFVYWTLALGLGSLSLATSSALGLFGGRLGSDMDLELDAVDTDVPPGAVAGSHADDDEPANAPIPVDILDESRRENGPGPTAF